ncbi:MAG: bifunctional DNA-formamidopyrimidine glycosylase/DNA-(apurinic or apyrimidinic site) lyase [bacterium]
MPELPEVHTIIYQIKPFVEKSIIRNLVIFPKGVKMILPYSVEELRQNVKGKTIKKIERLGKYIIFNLSNSENIIAHLRMTGSLQISKHVLNHQHNRLYLDLGEVYLNFIDLRRFATFHFTKNKSEYLKKVGMDALDKKLNVRVLQNLARNSSVSIYKFLLDQQKIAGIGNIYANEIMFLAQINPECSVNKISLKKWQIIFDKIKLTLEQAISFNGTTILNFKDSHDESGKFQEKLFVYGREGKLCKVCGSKILRKKINGRSVFYCLNCQC